MVDPRLNSLHLDPVRRQDYRRAREALLQSRGQQTLYAECQHSDDAEPSSTFIRNLDAGAPVHLDYWLVDKEFIYPLRVGLNTVGRASDNDVILQDSYVSRRHCAILVHSDQSCELHDTASKNGTYLNGTRLGTPVSLKSGDEIRICDRQLVFLAKPHARPATPTTPTIAERASDVPGSV
jgi:hypothetical protein